MSATLVFAFRTQQARVRELLAVRHAKPGADGIGTTRMMEMALERSEDAASSGDPKALVRSLRQLMSFQ